MDEYVLKVTARDLEVLAAGLNELPRKVSQPVFSRLQGQVEEQDRARAAEVAAKAEAEAKKQDKPAKEPAKKGDSK